MRLTLKKVVDKVLSDMTSAEVNSIVGSDVTEEALQVVSIAEDVYYTMVDEYQLPSQRRVITLEAAGTGFPNYLKLPARVKHVKELMYNKRLDTDTKEVYTSISYLPPEEFLYYITKRDTSASNVETVNDPVTGIPVFVVNDRPPTYWTSFDDTYICFDSYDSAVDTELQSSKSMCYAEVPVAWQVADNFDIPLPDHLQSLYLNEVKSICFITIKQAANEKVEQQAKRLRFNVQSQKDRTQPSRNRPDYGRR
jgi:hypothetical protein